MFYQTRGNGQRNNFSKPEQSPRPNEKESVDEDNEISSGRKPPQKLHKNANGIFLRHDVLDAELNQ